MASFRQASFAGGEISPRLYGRSDLAKYATALRACRDCIITPEGAIENRPGWAYVTPAKSAEERGRIIRFDFADDQNYLVEFGAGYVRFHADGAPVSPVGAPAYAGGTTYVTDQYVTSGVHTYRSLQDANVGHTPASSPTWWTATDIYELETPYTAVQLVKLKHAQSGDTLYLQEGTHGTQVLQRLGAMTAATPWKFQNWTPDSITGVIPPAPVDLDFSVAPDTTGDSTHIKRVWQWVVTAVGPTGVEGPPTAALGNGTSDKYAFGRAVGPPEVQLIYDMPVGYVASNFSYNVYRGRNGVFGFLLNTKSRVPFDDGDAPDYAIRPPDWIALFDFNVPQALTFFEQRLIFGNTQANPATVWCSKTGNFVAFDANWMQGPLGPPRDDQAIELTLSGLRFQEIRSFVPLTKLIAFTNGGVWAISGFDGSPLTPSSLEVRQHSAFGASWLDPLVVGNTVLYVSEKDQIVRDLAFEQQAQSYGGVDLTLLSRHFFTERTIVDWTYARDPGSVVWLVLDDGSLLSLTYIREQEVWAWCKHSTDGVFENVCAVSEGREDRVYAIVRRTVGGTTKRYIERMASRVVTDVREGLFLDCALSADLRNTTDDTVTLQNATGWDAGDQVDIVKPDVAWNYADVDSLIVLDPDGDSPVRLQILSLTNSITARAEAKTPIPEEFRETETTDWAFARRTFSGLTHLNGEEVEVLADGYVAGPLTVVGGAITLQSHATIVHAGLPYISDVELLDLPDEKLKEKLVHRVGLEVEASRGPQIGEDFDHLETPKEREVSDGYNRPIPLSTRTIDVRIRNSWNKSGRIAIRQVDPLPLTILAVTREVAPGGI